MKSKTSSKKPSNLCGKKRMKPFTCSVCFKEFNLTSPHLNRTLEIKVDNNLLSYLNNFRRGAAFKCKACYVTPPTPMYSYECSICKRVLGRKWELLNHMKNHEDNHQCSACNQIYPDEKSLAIHVKVHAKSSCSEEVVSGDSVNGRSTHLEMDFPENFTENTPCHKCIACGLSFESDKLLSEHNILHFNKPVKCRFCKKEFKDNYELSKHRRRLHLEPNLYKSDKLLSMYIGKHTLEPCMCLMCNKEFSDKTALVRHFKKHSEIDQILSMHIGKYSLEPYTCMLCNKALKFKGLLVRHFRLRHSEEDTFECDDCGRKFKERLHMELHKKTCMELKCTDCSKTFKGLVNLLEHLQKEHLVKSFSMNTKFNAHEKSHEKVAENLLFGDLHQNSCLDSKQNVSESEHFQAVDNHQSLHFSKQPFAINIKVEEDN